MSKMRDIDSYIIELTKCMRESADNITALKKKTVIDRDNYPESLKLFANRNLLLRGKTNPISVITGVKTSDFPQADELTEDHVLHLLNEMSRLLKAYSFRADYPQQLPVKQKYDLLKKKWDEKHEYSGDTIVYLECCDCDPTSCPFLPKFCRCKDFNGFVDFFDDSTFIF